MEKLGLDSLVFITHGMKWTLILAIVSFACGSVSGLLVALLRTSKWAGVRRLMSLYIAVFQGTPLLMQLFVVYFGLPLLGINLDPWIAVAVAFTLHASAFLGDIWRGGIESIPRGQTEGANALGMGYLSRMKDVTLPQALKISLPATVGFVVQLTKGTSLAATVGFVELARAGQIVSNATLQPLPVFFIVGALYFAVCWPMSLYGSRLERRLSIASR